MDKFVRDIPNSHGTPFDWVFLVVFIDLLVQINTSRFKFLVYVEYGKSFGKTKKINILKIKLAKQIIDEKQFIPI